MGLLDPKQRFLDTILTEEGRRQIASGKLRAEFYSFSDSNAVYSAEDMFVSGSGFLDHLATIATFEAGSSKQDRITYESDDSGKLIVKEIQSLHGQSVKILDGQLFSGSYGNKAALTNVTDINDMSLSLLSGSLTNFQELRLIRSPDPLTDASTFSVSENALTFDILNDKPIASEENGGMQTATIDNIESLFADKRLSHLPNFQFLPPINKLKNGSSNAMPIGVYANINQQPIETYADIDRQVKRLDDMGFVKTITFPETSQLNKLFGQFFENSSSGITKLDVIDFGIFTTTGNELSAEEIALAEERQQLSFTKHVFFVGKLYKDSNGSDTFVNIFTLIFS